MNSWINELLANPVFAGIAGGAGMSAVLYQLRSIPQMAMVGAQRLFTTSMVIDNSDELFDRLAIHLSRSKSVQKARWLRMVELYDDEQQKWCWKVSFGPGWHLIKDNGSRFLVHRYIEEKSSGFSLTRRETMTIRTLGRDQAPLRQLMQRAEQVYDTGETVRVHLFNCGAYALADRKRVRDPDTLFIPQGQKDRIIGDLSAFMGAEAEYRRRGTPYRRGYLFEGPPGTGKTSLAFVMAGIARRPIYILNLNTCGGDTGLQMAFNAIEPGSFVVIEDIDTNQISHTRAEQPPSPSMAPTDAAAQRVTLGGLLNAIDGLASRENRILIMTTNHPEKLDAALLRPGRMDVRERLEHLDEGVAYKMSVATLGERADPWFERNVKPSLPISPARLQELLMAA